jgi:HTH-type transcriptional regulator / antitoxin HigA
MTLMNIKPIKTDTDNRAALKEIEALMSAELESPEGEKLDILVTLVEAYESKHYPLDLTDQVEAIKFEMEQKGLSVKDLEPMIGKSNRVYEVLTHKRSLTLKMIRRLHEQLGIPAVISPPTINLSLSNLQNRLTVSVFYKQAKIWVRATSLQSQNTPRKKLAIVNRSHQMSTQPEQIATTP